MIKEIGEIVGRPPDDYKRQLAFKRESDRNEFSRIERELDDEGFHVETSGNTLYVEYEKDEAIGGHSLIRGQIARLEEQLGKLKEKLLVPEEDTISGTDNFIEDIVGRTSSSSTELKWDCETEAEAKEIARKLASIEGVEVEEVS